MTWTRRSRFLGHLDEERQVHQHQRGLTPPAVLSQAADGAIPTGGSASQRQAVLRDQQNLVMRVTQAYFQTLLAEEQLVLVGCRRRRKRI
jgi:hypothetical protein